MNCTPTCRREDDRFAWLKAQIKRLSPENELRAELKIAVQATVRHFEADVVAELVDAIKVKQSGRQASVSLVFEYWRRRSPSILNRLDRTLRVAWPIALSISQGKPFPLSVEEASEIPCPLSVEDFTAGFRPSSPAEPLYMQRLVADFQGGPLAFDRLDPLYKTLLLEHPLIFRGYGHVERRYLSR